MKQLLIDLRDAVRGLKTKNFEIGQQLDNTKRQLEDAHMLNEALKLEVFESRRKCSTMQAAYGEARNDLARREMEGAGAGLGSRVDKLEKERKMMWGAVVCCIGIILGIVMSRWL